MIHGGRNLSSRFSIPYTFTIDWLYTRYLFGLAIPEPVFVIPGVVFFWRTRIVARVGHIRFLPKDFSKLKRRHHFFNTFSTECSLGGGGGERRIAIIVNITKHFSINFSDVRVANICHTVPLAPNGPAFISSTANDMAPLIIRPGFG